MKTIEEGVYFTKEQLKNYEYDKALIMLKDVMEGIVSIENAIMPFCELISENNFKKVNKQLIVEFSKALDLYESKDLLNFKNKVDNDIISKFILWKEEIERVLSYHIFS